MAEFMIAVLIVSLLWVMWDVIKLILKEKYQEEQGKTSLEPDRQRMKHYAESFHQLADTFQKLPARREGFRTEEIREILGEVQQKVCVDCPGQEICWKEQGERRFREFCHLSWGLEDPVEGSFETEVQTYLEECSCSAKFLEVLRESSRVARLNLMWSNRLLENREAVAEQLYGTAAILEVAASLAAKPRIRDQELERQMDVRLRMQGVLMSSLAFEQGDGHQMEAFLTLRTARKGRCVSAREIAGVVSQVCGRMMVPHGDSRRVINSTYSTVHFRSEPTFVMTTGAARATMEGEMVSGDNFSMFCRENGQMIMSLSDGMGSGASACQESETVIELLEQFLEAGFAKETAVSMIHATMALANTQQQFSTVDLSVIDLYTGTCDFLKVGASTTFIRHENRVEALVSTSLPMGMFGKLDYESARKRLEPGDFLIMVSDGVMDALPHRRGEEVMQELILKQETKNAQEMAGSLLTQVLMYRKCQAADDMTILVGGFWKRKK